jgi:hypothetical protein
LPPGDPKKTAKITYFWLKNNPHSPNQNSEFRTSRLPPPGDNQRKRDPPGDSQRKNRSAGRFCLRPGDNGRSPEITFLAPAAGRSPGGRREVATLNPKFGTPDPSFMPRASSATGGHQLKIRVTTLFTSCRKLYSGAPTRYLYVSVAGVARSISNYESKSQSFASCDRGQAA